MNEKEVEVEEEGEGELELKQSDISWFIYIYGKMHPRARTGGLLPKPSTVIIQLSYNSLYFFLLTTFRSSNFEAGFKIWNEHNKLSSTDIIAPALSNSPQ